MPWLSLCPSRGYIAVSPLPDEDRTVPDLYRLTATEASKLIAKREISSEELVKSCLARIREREPTVQAWAHLDEKLALQAARAGNCELAPLECIESGHPAR